MPRILALIVVIVAIAAAGLTWSAFQEDVQESRQRVASGSKTVTTPFGQVEYAEAGQGAPLLVVHGSGGGFDQALAFSKPLQGMGFRILAPSRFGYLGSSFPDGASPELQADAFDALLGALGQSRVAILGGSAGALSAMQLAIRHPDRCRALILLVPASYAPDRPANTNAADNPLAEGVARLLLRSDFLFWAFMKVAPDRVTRLLLATEPAVVEAASLSERTRVANTMRQILPVSRRADGLLLDAATAGAPPPYALERIICPVLAISVEDDLYGTAQSARYAAANVPDGRLIIYPSGGHLWVGHDADVWREVAAFLAAVPE